MASHTKRYTTGDTIEGTMGEVQMTQRGIPYAAFTGEFPIRQ